MADFKDIKKDLENEEDAAVEFAKKTYELGRQASIQAKPVIKKAWDVFWRSNVGPYLVLIFVGIAGIYWLDSYFTKRDNQHGYVPADVSKPLISLEKSPIENPSKKIEIQTLQKNGNNKVQEQTIDLWEDEEGTVYVNKDSYEKVKVVERNMKIDFTIRFGIAAIVNPMGKDTEDIIQPGLVVSPFTLFNRFSVDGFVTPKEAGAGASYRMPFKRFRNTFIGGGIAFPYDGTEKHGVLLFKVNF